jgi:AP2 domain
MSTPPRPDYGITRIDQPDKKNHGYYVRITHQGIRYQKYFPDKSSGGKVQALKAAKNYRDGIVATLPESKQEAASKKRRPIKKSGITGVTHVVSKSVNGKDYDYWQAAWVDEANRRKTAKFSISRYGEDTALNLAKKARKEGVTGKR